MNFFITATDTNAGKTYVTALLTKAFRKAGHSTVAIKPLASGSWSDSEILSAVADHLITPQEITPFFFKNPLSPMQAAPLEEKIIHPPSIIVFVEKMKKKHPSLFVEGVGGWKVPLTYDFTTADLAAAIRFPVLLVVRNRLGAKNHALLTLDSIKAHGLSCAGMILNHLPEDELDPAIPGYREFFKNFAKREELPFLEISPHQKEVDPSFLQKSI
ncbi:MAG: dethiobiotin synthase [Verrucomicrobia bacterium]|nr:dethiobiotin synthase [Verrucomicrobiota bacterium]